MRPRAVPEFSAPFSAFWEMWPRKVAKLAAWKEWQAWKCDSIEEILPALRLQLPAFCQRDPEHVPHASTWLHQRRWEDEVIVRKNAPPARSQGPSAKPEPSLPPPKPFRCNLHEKNPRARWSSVETSWCPSCREHAARTAGREGEPVGLDELLKGDNMPWAGAK